MWFITPADIMGFVARSHAQDLTYPKTFRTREIAANGTKLHVRIGGAGPVLSENLIPAEIRPVLSENSILSLVPTVNPRG
jgi:hypothetical protein